MATLPVDLDVLVGKTTEMGDLAQAQAVFETLRAEIDAGCKNSDFSYALTAAEKLGLKESQDNKSLTTLIYNYIRTWDNGIELHLNFRSYDPSGPFQNIPDVNKFRLELISGEKVAYSHTNGYNG